MESSRDYVKGCKQFLIISCSTMVEIKKIIKKKTEKSGGISIMKIKSQFSIIF